MLPIFRIISVGGVTLAITILILALIPPGGSHLVLAQHDVVARGPLIDQDGHPEWRPFLIHAALRRAGELERLRELRDTIVQLPEAVETEPRIEIVIEAPSRTGGDPQVAGLPSDDTQGDDDVTGSIGSDHGATIPIEIGEASSTELPVTAVEDSPPVVRVPALQMPSLAPPASPALEPPPAAAPAIIRSARKADTRKRAIQQRSRRKPPVLAAAPQPLPPPFNILAAIFGSFARSDGNAQTTPPLGNAVPPPGNRQASAAGTAPR